VQFAILAESATIQTDHDHDPSTRRQGHYAQGDIPDAGILIRDGEIASIGSRADLTLPAGAQEVRAEDSTAIPGFIDVHIHGAGGRDVMEGKNDALATVTGRLAQFGTTSLLATTVTADSG
jgi:N-acetylglucosamine-6-phosphate deacetylase